MSGSSETVTELVVDMTCGNCQKKVNAALTAVPGVTSVDIDLASKRVLVTGLAPTAALVDAVAATGKKAAVAGKSSAAAAACAAEATFLSAVAQFTSNAVKGLVRFTDLPEKRALVEIDFDGLAPNLKHAVGVHRSGNVSAPDCSLCGPVIEAGSIATIVADANGRARLQVEAPRLLVDDIIGRSVVVRSEAAAAATAENARVACAVVARSAGAQQNDKRICLCDGTTIWESKATTAASKPQPPASQ